MISEKRKAEFIIESVCQYYNITQEDIFSRKRYRYLVDARHISMALCRRKTSLSLEQIGLIHNRDHATVLHSIKKIDGLMTYDNKIIEQHKEIDIATSGLDKLKKSYKDLLDEINSHVYYTLNYIISNSINIAQL